MYVCEGCVCISPTSRSWTGDEGDLSCLLPGMTPLSHTCQAQDMVRQASECLYLLRLLARTRLSVEDLLIYFACIRSVPEYGQWTGAGIGTSATWSSKNHRQTRRLANTSPCIFKGTKGGSSCFLPQTDEESISASAWSSPSNQTVNHCNFYTLR